VAIVIGSNITFGSGIIVGSITGPVVTYIVEEDNTSQILTETGDSIIEEN
jgi:hypothetical protein